VPVYAEWGRVVSSWQGGIRPCGSDSLDTLGIVESDF
jgi:hypothetical protein